MTAIATTVATKKTQKDLWEIHRAAADKAVGKGADFWCAQRMGFAAAMTAVSTMKVRPKLCAKCSKRGVGA